jgi:hypothetical protein
MHSDILVRNLIFANCSPWLDPVSEPTLSFEDMPKKEREPGRLPQHFPTLLLAAVVLGSLHGRSTDAQNVLLPLGTDLR